MKIMKIIVVYLRSPLLGEKVSRITVKNFHKAEKHTLLFKKLQRERSHFEKATAGQETKMTIILQILLGNRN